MDSVVRDYVSRPGHVRRARAAQFDDTPEAIAACAEIAGKPILMDRDSVPGLIFGRIGDANGPKLTIGCYCVRFDDEAGVCVRTPGWFDTNFAVEEPMKPEIVQSVEPAVIGEGERPPADVPNDGHNVERTTEVPADVACDEPRRRGNHPRR